MESVESVLKMLATAWLEDDKQALMRIFADAPGHFKTVPDKHRETVLRMIFDENKGIIKFINTVLENVQASQLNQYDKILKQVFHVIQFLMEFFKFEYEAYILLTKTICLLCIKKQMSLDVKIEASKTLKLLIQLFHGNDLQLIKQISSKIFRLFRDEHVLLIAVGASFRHYPRRNYLKKLADSIYLVLLTTLNNECTLRRQLQLQEYINIYLECLSDMVINYKPFQGSGRSLCYKILYKVFESLSDEYGRTSEITFKIILIMSSQIEHFSKYIFKDYIKWHDLVQDFYKNNSISGEPAAKNFYKIISLQLMETYHEDVFLNFRNYFSTKFGNESLSNDELNLAIYGFGYFSAVYAKYSSLEMDEIFQKIMYRTISFPANKNDALSIQMLPCYLQAITQILNCMPNFKTHHLDILIKLSVFVFEKFPELDDRNKSSAINALKITFKNIYKLEQIFQQQYFDRLFYKRILWSCSHPLFIDVELQREIQNLPEHPISYKDSLQLWHELLKIQNDDEKLVKNVFKEIISGLFYFIENLDLNINSQPDKLRPDVCLSYRAKNEAHFRYFINLVDLYIDIFKEIEINLLQVHVEKLLKHFIKCSYKHPLVSGFYKLIEAMFKKLDNLYNYETRFHKYTCELISQYLLDVLQKMSRFSNELLLSCIYLVFSSPLFFIGDIVNETVPIFEVAFEIGLKNNIPLTFYTLETLEKWRNSFKDEYVDKFWKNILDYVEPDFVMQTSSIRDKNIEKLQKKIFALYNSVDQKVPLNFISEKSIDINSLWTKNRLLLFQLHFTGTQLNINFDKFLPRVIELVNTENRRKKISACEFLHMLVKLILGKKITDFHCKNLFCTVLKLGCDTDETIWNLYHPLVIQLTHYLSSKQMIESKISQDFFNSLFDGLIQEFNPSLRDYCGICLKEFVRWMIKQSPGNDSSTSTNFHSLFNRIINFALHPSNSKKLAAVIAFNFLYPILKGSISVINTYWLEFLYAFVKCLEKCNDIRVVSALNNVERVIEVAPSLLNANNYYRRRHVEFSNETLRDAVTWLFNQCGVLNADCREKSMQLFEKLCILVPGNKCVKDFISSLCIGCVNAIALKNLDQDFENINVNNTMIFLRSLDFYIWMFKKKYLTPKRVFLVKSDKEGKGVFFKFFSKFMLKLVGNNLKEFIKTTTNSLKEAEELNNSLNTVMLRIVDFTSIVLKTEETALEEILKNLWSDNLNLFISRFTLCPRDIGLTSKLLQTTQPQLLEKWLTLIMEKLPEPYLMELKQNFFREKTEDCKNFFNIPKIINLEVDVDSLSDFVYGMIILKSCKFYNLEKELSISDLEKKISSIFEGLTAVKMSHYVKTKTEVYITPYLRKLLQFVLLEYKSELMECIVNLITYCDMFFTSSSNSTSTSYHEDFLEPLKTPIFQYMLRNPSTSLQILYSKLRDSPDKLLTLIENLLYFAQRNHTKQSDKLAKEVIKKFDNYRALINENDRLLDRFYNINTMAVELNPMGVMPADGAPIGLYGWILEEFNKANDLERKAIIIESFLICMTDDSDKPNPDLTLVLWNLREGNSENWFRSLQNSEIEKSRAVQCLRSLLKMLLVTKSWIVFEGLIKYTAGVCKIFAKESIIEHVKSFFSSKLLNSRYPLLERLHQIFQDTTSFSAYERLDILQFFLLPCLEACRVSIVGEFYEQTRAELANTLRDELNVFDGIQRKQDLVNKIGSYRIFELMFGRLTSAAKEAVDFLLFYKTFEVRSFSSTITEDQEIVRLLHCAALNCCIAVAGSTSNDERYAVMFREFPQRNIFLWHRIVDCKRQYNYQPGPLSLNKRIVNIRRTPEDLQIPVEPTFDFYCNRYDPTDIDFNKCNNPTDRRQLVILEEDEFNEHECAAMITGIIIHLSKSMPRPPDVDYEMSEADLPLWFLSFTSAFKTTENNVRLLLLRIVSNARNIFIPYLRFLFEEITRTIISYLKENALNYLIRDILFIFIESKYDPKRQSEVSVAQELLETVIDRANDESDNVCLYNLKILENLINMWEKHLKAPKNLEIIIERDEVLAINVVLMLFRNHIDKKSLIKKHKVHKLVRKLMFRLQEPTAPQAFETLGWITRFITKEQRNNLVKDDLVDLFVDMQRLSRDICVRNFYLTFIGCPILSVRKELRRFRDPVPLENDDRRAECFEIFLESMTALTIKEIHSMLDSMNLKGLLRDRVLPCIDVGFRILDRLAFIFKEPQMLPYAQIIEIYTTSNNLLEHKKMAYPLFMYIFEKMTNERNRMEVEVESNPNELLILSRRILINGTIDPSDEIQDLLLIFWKERFANIATTSQRLCHLLKLYTPEIDSSFSQFFCAMMLDLSNHKRTRDRYLFAPLFDCRFEEQEVATSRRWEGRRTQHVNSAPLFAPSLTGMLERVVIEQGSRMRRLDRNKRLQETPVGALATSLDLIDRLAMPNGPIRCEYMVDPSRIQTPHAKTQTFISQQSLIDNYYERIKQEEQEQRDSAKINCIHRIGNYPYVEILQSDVVVTLDDLARQDEKFANDLLVSIICATADSIEDEAFNEEFTIALSEFCRNVLKQSNNAFTASAAMELLLKNKCTDFDVNDVVRVAKAMNCQALGILLLEMVSIETNQSKYSYQTQSMFASPIVQPLHHIFELSNLYRSIGERDVVKCISRNWILPAGLEPLYEGSIKEAMGDWISAKAHYVAACESLDGSCKDYCEDGLLRCLGELSSWTDINKRIDVILNKNYDSVWQNSRRDDLLPWIFTAQLQKKFEDIAERQLSSEIDFTAHLDAWIASQANSITRAYGDQLCMFYLCSQKKNSETMARRYLQDFVEYVSEQLEPAQKMTKFKKIHELEVYLNTLKSKDIVGAVTELVLYWQRMSFDEDDDLFMANQWTGFRLAFANVLIEKLKNGYTDSGILIEVLSASLNERLKISELAISNRNKPLANKHIIRIKHILNGFDNTNVHYAKLSSNFYLTVSRYKLLCAEIENNLLDKVDYCINAWQLADTIIKTKSFGLSRKIEAKLHIFDIVSKLFFSLSNNVHCIQKLADNGAMKNILGIETTEQILDELSKYRWKIIKDVCNEGSNKDMARSYTKFVEYCCELIDKACNLNSYLHEELISAILTGMSLGSTKIARYFPRLLETSLYDNSAPTVNIFVEKCKNVPTWMFLLWQEQIQSCLNTSLMTLTLPIVKRLAKEYPSAIIYSFRRICNDYPNLRCNSEIENICNTLFSNIKIETFFKAMEYVCQPEQYLQHNLTLLFRLVDNREIFSENLDSFLQEISETSSLDHLKGPVYKEVFSKYYYNTVRKLKHISDNEIVKRQIKKLYDNLDISMTQRLKTQKTIKSSQLTNYSPYLSDFVGEDLGIEIPGQYTGDKKPLTQSHAKIMKVEGLVEVINGCGYLKISLLGTDGQSNEFLVKIGTDLRCDQRMQKMFNLINETMLNNITSKKRNMSMHVYNVVPFSKSLGLIEWIGESKTLKEFITVSMVNKSDLHAATVKFQNWIEEAAIDEPSSMNEFHKRALLKYRAKDVDAKINELAGSFSWDLLRSTFIKLGQSIEDTFRLRQNFIKSYATMCTVHWIMGVGNRCMDKILIEKGTGKCVGLDYRVAFGAGLDQPIPELVPFRLTMQILGLLRPFGEKDLLGSIMHDALSAIKNEKKLILVCLHSFLNEPIDRNQMLDQIWKQDNKDILWLSKEKIEIVERKLNGAKPSNVMLDELLSCMRKTNNVDEKQYFAIYKHIVNGTELYHHTTRAFINEAHLTTEDQVLCLLDQATDKNVLGRMSSKWIPFL